MLLCLLLGAQGWVVYVRKPKRLPIRKLITSTGKAISTPLAMPRNGPRRLTTLRDAWQKPDEVLNALHLQRTDRVVDLGAGTGYFSVRIARLVPERKLFSVDIEPEMLRHLRERAHHENLSVLVPILASAESANRPEPVDLVLVVDTYHHIDNRNAYFSKLKTSLRPNGRLAVVDFKADSPEGPPLEHRIPPEKVTSELEAAGYTLVANHPFLPRQYFLVFQAKTS